MLLLGGGGDDGGGGAGPTAGTGTTGTTTDAAPAFAPTVADGGIEGGELPVGVAASGGDVYIADRTGKQLIHGNGETMKAVKTASLNSAPEDVVVEGDSVFVSMPADDAVLKFDPDLAGEPQQIPLGGGSKPQGITAAERQRLGRRLRQRQRLRDRPAERGGRRYDRPRSTATRSGSR